MNDYSNFETEVFSCNYEGQTAVICLKSESFRMAMDASMMHDMLECLNAIEIDRDIKGVLMLHTATYERVEVLKKFIKSIQKESGYVQKEMGVARYGSAVKRLTLALNDFSKPIVVGMLGQVPIDSFGYFLPCDYRVASDDLSIEFPGLQIGVTPAGAASFFMKRQLGSTKTLQLLTTGKSISAEEAKNLCLISEIVPREQLKTAGLAQLEEFYKIPGSTLNYTKQLVRPRTHELEEHFELCSRLMWNSIIDN